MENQGIIDYTGAETLAKEPKETKHSVSGVDDWKITGFFLLHETLNVLCFAAG